MIPNCDFREEENKTANYFKYFINRNYCYGFEIFNKTKTKTKNKIVFFFKKKKNGEKSVYLFEKNRVLTISNRQ